MSGVSVTPVSVHVSVSMPGSAWSGSVRSGLESCEQEAGLSTDLSCARINVQCNSSFVSAQTHFVLIVEPVALDMFGAFALFRMNADMI